MDVPSIPFLLLAAGSAGLYNLSRALLWRQSVLLVTNLTFLFSFVKDPTELLPYAAFLILGFGLMRGLHKGISAWIRGLAILTVLIAFCWLKQYNFLPKGIFITSPYLVVGLSYVCFRVMHLVIDAGDREDRIRPIDYVNYTLNFTSLISGPIQRYEDYHRMVSVAPLPLRLADMGDATERIVTGLFKILVIAVGISALQRALTHQVLSEIDFVSRTSIVVAMAALYPVYLFFNFSGYTDVVIGVGRFFRIKLPENFDMPFSSASFIEYWSRWHMSLSNWLKTYVYNPLLKVLMRRVKNPVFFSYCSAAALFVTFFLIGVWHGRTSEFFFFGLLNGLGMAVNQAYRTVAPQRLGRKKFAALSKTPFYLSIGRGLTFTWVAFTMLWFWSDWPQIQQFAEALGYTGVIVGVIALFISSSVILTVLSLLRRAALAPSYAGRPILLSHYTRTVWLSAMIFLVVGVQAAMDAAAPDVVYKNF